MDIKASQLLYEQFINHRIDKCLKMKDGNFCIDISFILKDNKVFTNCIKLKHLTNKQSKRYKNDFNDIWLSVDIFCVLMEKYLKKDVSKILDILCNENKLNIKNIKKDNEFLSEVYKEYIYYISDKYLNKLERNKKYNFEIYFNKTNATFKIQKIKMNDLELSIENDINILIALSYIYTKNNFKILKNHFKNKQKRD